MMLLRRLIVTIAICLPAQAVAQSSLDLPERPIDFEVLKTAFEPIPVAISTRTDCRQLNTLFADTNAKRARGLMFVSTMPDNAGMLFYYPVKRQMSMWMKNTLIPLDLLFATQDGEIINIIEHAEPLTLDSRGATAPVQYVLELNAGMAQHYGLVAGERMFITNPAVRD